MDKKNTNTSVYRVVCDDKQRKKPVTMNLTAYKEIAGAEFSNNGKLAKRFFPKEVHKWDAEKKEFVALEKKEATEVLENAVPTKKNA